MHNAAHAIEVNIWVNGWFNMYIIPLKSETFDMFGIVSKFVSRINK